MGAALSLRFFRPRLSVFREEYTLRIHNPLERLRYKAVKESSAFKIGDIVTIMKIGHYLYGKEAKVINTYGKMIEVLHIRQRRFFDEGELKWIRFSSC